MFDNIGGKIKSLARVVCWIGIISSIITGLITIFVNEDMILTGVLLAVIGSFLSWIGSFFAYGFGQLVENSDTLVAQNMCPREHVNYEPEPVSEGLWVCKNCGTHNKKEYGQCKKCGTYRS